jgi:hypothetical protein
MGAPGRTTGKLFTPIECQVLLPEPERVARKSILVLMPSACSASGALAPVYFMMLIVPSSFSTVGLLDRGLTQQSNTVSLVSDLNHVSEATHNLHAMIGKALDYVNKVCDCSTTPWAHRWCPSHFWDSVLPCLRLSWLVLVVLTPPFPSLSLNPPPSAASVQVVDGQQHGDPEVGRSLRDTISAVPKIDPAKFHAMFNNSVQDLLMLMYLSNLTQSQVALQDKINEVL